MSASLLSEKYDFQFSRFCGGFIFWFLCIPFNVIPIYLKYWMNITPETYISVHHLMILIVGDIDFIFISTSSVFVLCMESFFASEDFAKIYKTFRTIAIIYEFVLLLLYISFFWKPSMFELLGTMGRYYYNLVLLALTIVLGILCNITISMKRGVAKW